MLFSTDGYAVPAQRISYFMGGGWELGKALIFFFPFGIHSCTFKVIKNKGLISLVSLLLGLHCNVFIVILALDLIHLESLTC